MLTKNKLSELQTAINKSNLNKLKKDEFKLLLAEYLLIKDSQKPPKYYKNILNGAAWFALKRIIDWINENWEFD